MKGLLCCNLLQGGVFQAVVGWVIVVDLTVMHIMSFKTVEPKFRAIPLLVYHLLIVAQTVAALVTFMI